MGCAPPPPFPGGSGSAPPPLWGRLKWPLQQLPVTRKGSETDCPHGGTRGGDSCPGCSSDAPPKHEAIVASCAGRWSMETCNDRLSQQRSEGNIMSGRSGAAASERPHAPSAAGERPRWVQGAGAGEPAGRCRTPGAADANCFMDG